MALVDTTTGEIVSDLSRAEARDLTDTIKSNVDSLWSLLKESHDRKAWAALGYGSWREYATTEFGISQSRAYQMLDQAKVIAELEAAAGDSTIVEIPEGQARILKPALAEAKRAVEEATAGGKTPEEKKAAVDAALSNLSRSLGERQRQDAAARAEQQAARRTPAEEISSFVAADSDVQVAQLRKRFADALVRAGSAFNFDTDTVAPHLRKEEWLIVRHSAQQAADWYERLLKQQPTSLQVMKGGRS